MVARAGAVGSLALQLAVASGVTVIATASAGSQDYLAALGASPTAYGVGLVDRVRALAPRGIDAVFDVAVKGALPDSIALRGVTGRIITIAGFAAQSLTFSSGSPETRSTTDLADLAGRATRGDLLVMVAGRYPLADAASAHRITDAGHGCGKLVLTVA
jgi:NADPH:quinone reductase-like Zn-dependent oxidoreductase